MSDLNFLLFVKNILLLLAVNVFLHLPPANGQSQSGRVYEFINLPATARITGQGGYAAPHTGNDLGMALFYPALMEHMTGSQLSLNFANYFGDISYGTAAASSEFNKLGKVNAAVQFINYGTFTHADELGNQQGEFTGAEYAVSLGWGRDLSERFSIGSNIRFINSVFEQYSSFGLAADVGFAYVNSEKEWVSSLVFRNMGRQITNYEGENEPLPFDIVLGVSKKLINAPLRFSIVAHNLHKPDLTYTSHTDNDQTFLSNEAIPAETDRMAEIGDQLMRHLVFGMEFLPTR
ncbi:MAG: type IX secretion system protein PorQ, partial [Bacteroidota bacterium]